MTEYQFRLYVAGDTPRSHLAATNLRELLRATGAADHQLDIVDVLERPDLAEEERILATPYVIKLAPPPARRVVGDLNDLPRAARALDLQLKEGSS